MDCTSISSSKHLADSNWCATPKQLGSEIAEMGGGPRTLKKNLKHVFDQRATLLLVPCKLSLLNHPA